MINSLEITNHNNLPLTETNIKNAEWLERLEGRGPLNFGPDVNFLCGENGSGKTTLLTMIGNYFHCNEDGVPNITNKSVSKVVKNNLIADIFKESEKDAEPVPIEINDGCKFDNDSSLVFFVSSALDNQDSKTFQFDSLTRIFYKESAGEANMSDLAKFVDRIRNTKEIYGLKELKERDSKFKEFALASLYAFNKDKPPSKPTIILDELEANLDPINQMYFFKILFEQLSTWAQVIFTSHSILAFLMVKKYENVKIIETKRGYFNKTLRSLEENGFKISYKE